MAEINRRGRWEIFNYSTYDTTKVPLDGELRFFDTIHATVKGVYSVIGDGVSKVEELPFREVLNIESNANVSLEDYRITNNKVIIQNTEVAAITVNVNTAGVPVLEPLIPNEIIYFKFDGSNWVNLNGLGNVPVGSIIAWHKDLTGVPSLPSNYLECDGSVISDSDSLLDGQTLPDLNGDGRFLRGNAVSGTEQLDAIQGHHHELRNSAGVAANSLLVDRGNGTAAAGPNMKGTNENNSSQQTLIIEDPIADGVNGTPRTADETRPVNMTVVWIMRIK